MRTGAAEIVDREHNRLVLHARTLRTAHSTPNNEHRTRLDRPVCTPSSAGRRLTAGSRGWPGQCGTGRDGTGRSAANGPCTALHRTARELCNLI